jgi:transcriptional regulator with XRE-family HTH domain
LSLSLKSPQDVLREVGDRFKRRRLALDLTQAGLAKRSGVALGSLKRFETTGLVAFESLLKLNAPPLDEVLERSRTRKKGRMT